MKKYEIKLTSALVIDGRVVRAGTKIAADEATAKDFLRRGKAELVSAPEAPEVGDDDVEQVDLSNLNKDQLVDVAEQLGVEGVGKMTKAEIIAAIEAANEAE